MKPTANPRADIDWRDSLPPYGEARPPAAAPVPAVHPPVERRRRGRVLNWFIALGLGAVIAAIAISNLQDPRSLGTQLDEAIASVRGLGDQAGRSVADTQQAAAQASRDVIDGVGTALDDTGISLKVKTALAADPALSAARIDVTTRDGIVRLEGPAPDAAAKERATVLAGAPQGVRAVDNRLALPQPGQVVAVAGGAPQQSAAPASR